MNTLYESIETILLKADVEGLIEAGAPHDEYTTEAQEIAQAVSFIQGQDQYGYDAILSIVSLVFITNFDLSEEDVKQRLPVLSRISQEILNELS